MDSAEFLKHYAKLPPMPVPKLSVTLEQYLRTVKPLLSDEDFLKTEQLVKDFGAPGGVGQQLQELLEQKGSKEDNWLSGWWEDAAYLSFRLPVVVNTSPAGFFPKVKFDSQKEQLEYASILVACILEFKGFIDGAKLEQDFLGKDPLDMSQYTKLFNSCRIPRLEVDTVHQVPKSNHIVVAFNSSFYKLDVFDADGKPASMSEIFDGLLKIVNHQGGNEGVGFLTTENRDVWAIARQSLLAEDPVNRASLSAIEEAIIVLCLDKESPVPDGTSLGSHLALRILQGHGSEVNTGNRWFDKTIQIIVGLDGICGICYEHSSAEGGPLATLVDFMLDFARKHTVDHNEVRRLSSEPTLLTFNISEEISDAIELAKRNVDLLVQDIQMNFFTFDSFGVTEIKALNLSPDSFIQIAMQMAFMRLHGYPVAQYESAILPAFLKYYAKLPPLPVPKLSVTLEQYLRTVKPLLTDEDFLKTEQIVKDFGAPGGVGQKLQQLLEQKGSKEDNWLSGWWEDAAFLSLRLPLVNKNPAGFFPKLKFDSQKEQLEHAAILVAGALEFKCLTEGAKIEQDFLGKEPLDMSQYTKLFNSCRIPRLEVDTVRQAPISNHIVVASNNSFIVGLDGICGICYEHSSAEGGALANLVDFMLDFARKHTVDHNEARRLSSEPTLLTFNISEKISHAIELAKRNVDFLVQDLQMNFLSFDYFGVTEIKALKLSPDSFIQIALQMAFMRLHGYPVAQCESAILQADPIAKYKALQAAIKSHKDYVLLVVNGQGIDCHFLGLRKLAAENELDIPPFFLDTGFSTSSNWRVSTSQLFRDWSLVQVDQAISKKRLSFLTMDSTEFLKHYAKLPPLPVPKLSVTLEQYLRTVKPLLTDEDFLKTEQLAKDFGAPDGVGQKLQKLLEQKGSKEDNWLSGWWEDASYLSLRMPVVINTNPAGCFPKLKFDSQKEQLEHAAILVVGALEFKCLIDGAKIEQDFLGKDPLDMSQYTKLFNSCRIPRLGVDTVHQASKSSHIVVAFNNSFCKLDVCDSDGKPASMSEIFNGLLTIVNHQGGNEGVGFLTTENRDVWAVARQTFFNNKDPVNRASLSAIEEAIFVLCLDKESPAPVGTSLGNHLAVRILHGQGSEVNSGNRWFDKTIQLMVGLDGICGISYEHSYTEGGPVANLGDYILDFAHKHTVDHNEARRLSSEPTLLTFNISEEISNAIELAKRNVDLLVQDLQINFLSFDNFGATEIKALKLSPDSFIQIAMQMAFMRHDLCIVSTVILLPNTNQLFSMQIQKQSMKPCKQLLKLIKTMFYWLSMGKALIAISWVCKNWLLKMGWTYLPFSKTLVFQPQAIGAYQQARNMCFQIWGSFINITLRNEGNGKLFLVNAALIKLRLY
nr:EOG090X04D9 [Macrothrix elegans]